MNSAARIIRGVNAFCRTFSGVVLLAMTFVLFANILARNFMGYSYVGGDTLGSWLMVWLTFIGAAFIVPTHGHVAVDLLLRAAGVRLMRAVVVVTAIVGMTTSALMAFFGIQLTRFIFSTGEVETTLGVSPGFLYLPVGIGMVLLFINYADLLVAMIRKDDSRLPSVEAAIEPVVIPEEPTGV